MNIFEQWWATYLENGYNVLPCTGQAPKLNGWSQWNTKPMDEASIEEVLKQYSQGEEITGICMPSGPYSAMAIDIDAWVSDGSDLYAKAWELLGHSPMIKFGSKGFTAFFKPDDAIASAKWGESVEVFSNSGQVVLPPSYHPKTGGSYVWLPGKDLVASSDLPHWYEGSAGRNLFTELKVLAETRFKTLGSKRRSSQGGGIVGSEGRNNKLTAMAYAIASAGNPLDAGAVQIYEFDKINHTPPYFSDASEWKDKRSPLERAKVFYGRALKKAEAKVISSMKKVELPFDIEIVDEPKDILAMETDDYDMELEQLSPSASHRDFNSKINALSKQMLPLFTEGSMLCDFRTLAGSLGAVDVPTLHMAGALSLASIMASNVIECGKMRANIMSISLAGTGVGKDAPRKAITRVMEATMHGRSFLGEAHYRSVVAGILQGLHANPRHAKIDILDECQIFFQKMDTPNSDFGQAAGLLSTIFTSSNASIGKMSVMGGKSFDAIYNPYHVFHGFSQPSSLRPHIKPIQFKQGINNRMLWFIEAVPRDAVKNVEGVFGFGDAKDDKAVDAAFERLVTAANYWLGFMPVFEELIGDNPSDFYNQHREGGKPIKCNILDPLKNAEAMAVLKRIQDESSDMYQDGVDAGDLTAERFSRRAEVIRRVAMCYWMSTEGYKIALEAKEFEETFLDKAAKREAYLERGKIKTFEVGPEIFLWAEKLYDLQDQAFQVFMEMDSISLGMNLKGWQVVVAVSQDMRQWALSQPVGKIMREWIVQQAFKRYLAKRDPGGTEVKDPLGLYGKVKGELMLSGILENYISSDSQKPRLIRMPIKS